MHKLIKGIVDFRKQRLHGYRKKFANLSLGQSPDTLFIACCDSRVVPNVFASTDPGDLVVIRNMGNLIPPHSDSPMDNSVAAVIEFSLAHLNVSDIVICGHSECGAMLPFIETHTADKSLIAVNHWLENAAPSYDKFLSQPAADNCKLAPVNRLSRINVIQQLKHLESYPLASQRLQQGKLRIHGWWYDLATADVYHYDYDTSEFTLIDAKEAEKMLKLL
jgi:carbonic anhydrase